MIKPSDTLTRLRKYYGADFPGFEGDPKTLGAAWKTWLQKQFERQSGNRQIRNLHYTRHDNFRVARQWITSRDSRTWREPQSDKNSLRPVLNLVGPAANFRLGILMEQRPGFNYQPINSGSAGREVAEAQQAIAEYYFYAQRVWQIFLDALYYSQTHGVSFVHVYVDKTRGPSRDDVEVIPPTDERFGPMKELGYEMSEGGLLVPVDESGNFEAPGVVPRKLYEGELVSRVVLANETMADPEARTLNGPHDPARWFVHRRARDVKNVQLETGDDSMQPDFVLDADPNYETLDDLGARWQRGLPPFPTAKYRRHRDAVWEHNIYIPPATDALEDGSWLRIIGGKVIEQGDELPGRVIPFARFADGSPDPSLYPRPEMSDWIPDQVAINALLQSALQAARLGGGRMLAQKNTLLEETYSRIIGSVVEYTGAKPDVIEALRASPDIMPMMGFLIKQLENKTGWNDIARGQVTGTDGGSSMQDVSGRALLGAKELFERTFGPMVRAAAEGATEWSRIIVKYAQYIMVTPRLIPRIGRPDLAISISAEKLGDEPVTYCDPETLMPLPRSLREQMLFDHLQKGLITIEQYQQRSPYSDIRNLTMGDTPQWERAKWINTLLEEQWEQLSVLPPEQLFAPETGITILWQDTPGVHKNALQELILNERKPWGLRKLAADRWGIYDQLDRAMQDQTGQVQIPWEVVGVPPDRPEQQPPGAPAPPQAPPAPPGAPMAPGTSPSPEMSGPGTPAAAGMQPQPLGAMGQVERNAEQQQA